MSDDIKAGDIVVCIDDAPYRAPEFMVGKAWPCPKGSIWRVAQTRLFQGRVTLKLVGLQDASGLGFAVRRFRKLPKADNEFTRQIRACRPNKTKQPA